MNGGVSGGVVKVNFNSSSAFFPPNLRTLCPYRPSYLYSFPSVSTFIFLAMSLTELTQSHGHNSNHGCQELYLCLNTFKYACVQEREKKTRCNSNV